MQIVLQMNGPQYRLGAAPSLLCRLLCFRAKRPCRCCALPHLPCLAALVVDELQAEDGESPEEDHEGAQDAKDGADEGGPVVVKLLQVAPDGDAASTWYDHLHSNGMTSMNLINGDAELFLKQSWSKQLQAEGAKCAGRGRPEAYHMAVVTQLGHNDGVQCP